jgi:hypothetical protein
VKLAPLLNVPSGPGDLFPSHVDNYTAVIYPTYRRSGPPARAPLRGGAVSAQANRRRGWGPRRTRRVARSEAEGRGPPPDSEVGATLALGLFGRGGQTPLAHLLELGPGRHLLGEERGLNAVEEPLEPAHELGLGDP